MNQCRNTLRHIRESGGTLDRESVEHCLVCPACRRELLALLAAEDPGAVFDYRFVTEDTIEIMGYNGTETDLVIPSQINGYTVVGIGDLDLLGDDTDTVESGVPVLKKVKAKK